jgi:MPBQ/MSBQ methyltransferase
MGNQETVVANYGRDGLVERILALALERAAGGELSHDHLAVYDEFHMGGRFATAQVHEALDAQTGHTILDVGSGIGGPARRLAARSGACVVGVDLTPQHVEGATLLSEQVGLGDRTQFHLGDVTALKFPAQLFDGAMMLFVGMNVPDKPALFAEVRRVLRDGARFVIYDPMRTGRGEPDYPMPWAATAADSCLASASDYDEALTAAGFEIERTASLIGAVQELAAAQDREGETPGQQDVIEMQFGDQAPARFRNIAAAISGGVIEPRLVVAQAGR